jgi:transposase
MIRMLLIGYCLGIGSERRLCEEAHLNLAIAGSCRLGPERAVPDHPTFSKKRHVCFRDSDLLRRLFETTAGGILLLPKVTRQHHPGNLKAVLSTPP